jgi:aspartate/methionine/tyrosine aminotransferase
VLLLVNPSNPTGALTPHDSVTAIAALARDAGLFVISDEVYEKLAFGSGEVTSVATCPGMRERTVTLSSVSKSYAMTGFRVGFLLGPSPFIRAARRLKSAVSGPTPLFSQLAALAAVDGPQDVVVAFRKTFEERLGVVAPALDRLGVPYGKPGGGFFLWADVSQFAENAETFCRKLLLDERVLIFPGTAFGEKWKAHVRISLLQPVPRLEEAVARLTRFVDEAAGAS